MKEQKEKRKIDRRPRPPVKGIDLCQSMNYIELEDVSPDFIYNCYTSSLISYVPGSRPELEKVARKVCRGVREPRKRLDLLVKYVAEKIPWAGYYAQKTGRRLPCDRNLSEEEIIRSGFAWCNEQARLLCVLAQISGIPARLVFGSSRAGTYAHVTTELLTARGWLHVDQSLGYCFQFRGRPVSAWETWHVPAIAAHFGPIYSALCKQLEEKLGRTILARDFKMALAKNPLSGFEVLGYCNHFV